MTCETCGEEFTKDWRCDERTIRKQPTPKYCSRACANTRKWSDEDKLKKSLSLKGIVGHHVSEDYRKILSEKMKGNTHKPKALRIIRTCPVCGAQFITTPNRNKLYCSKECWNSISGGFREGSVKNHLHGVYGEHRYDSSWELIWIKWAIQQGIIFERNKQGFDYLFEGGSHKYYPDFYLPETDEYVEVKGIQDDLWEAKRQAFPCKLSVIGKKEIQELSCMV